MSTADPIEELRAAALRQPGARERASGMIKFQCPQCAADVPESYVTLSILHDDAGNAVEARAALARGLALVPAHPSVLVWAAIHARRHGDVLSEHRFLRAASTATAHDPAVGVALERLLTKLGDWHELKRLTAERAAVGAGGAVGE
jgi:Flp pilus assembly protein TadD